MKSLLKESRIVCTTRKIYTPMILKEDYMNFKHWNVSWFAEKRLILMNYCAILKLFHLFKFNDIRTQVSTCWLVNLKLEHLLFYLKLNYSLSKCMESHIIMIMKTWYWKIHENTCFNSVKINKFLMCFLIQNIYNLRNFFEEKCYLLCKRGSSCIFMTSKCVIRLVCIFE